MIKFIERCQKSIDREPNPYKKRELKKALQGFTFARLLEKEMQHGNGGNNGTRGFATQTH